MAATPQIASYTSKFVLTCLIFLVVWAVFRIVYNLCWHPLSRFPGPRHYAASRIPYIFSSFTGRLAFRFHELHHEYGTVVRTAPNELSFIGPSAWKTIYDRNNKHQTPFRKNYDSFDETRTQIRHSMYIAGDKDHARTRKILNHAFSPEALRCQEPLLLDHVQGLMQALECERLSNEKGIVDLEKWFSWVAFDMIADASFGEPFNSVHHPTYRSWPLMLSRIRKVITVVSGLNSIVPSCSLLRSLLPTFSVLQKTILQHAVDKLNFDLDKVRARIALQPTRGDILSSMIQQKGGKHDLNDEEILANASLFILAGSETVATLLCAVIYLLARNPVPFEKLATEIRQTFEDDSLITIQRLSMMEYLTACIEEALRMVPPVPEGLPRVTPSEGEEICGHWVPGGTFVQISLLAANLSPTNFKDPGSYIPERWLGCYPFDAANNKQACHPFSMGPRNCIGQSLAMAEVRLIVARMLRRYDLRYASLDSWTDQATYLLWERKSLLIEMRPRDKVEP